MTGDALIGFANLKFFLYLKKFRETAATEWDTLQRRTFYDFGEEKKSLLDVLGVMNMILHGIQAPSIRHTNTLTENVIGIQQRDHHDIVWRTRPSAAASARRSGRISPSNQARLLFSSSSTSFLI